VPPLENTNVYLSNVALREAVAREGAPWADQWLVERGGELGGSPSPFQHGFLGGILKLP
jgi:hypothetical protein